MKTLFFTLLFITTGLAHSMSHIRTPSLQDLGPLQHWSLPATLPDLDTLPVYNLAKLASLNYEELCAYIQTFRRAVQQTKRVVENNQMPDPAFSEHAQKLCFSLSCITDVILRLDWSPRDWDQINHIHDTIHNILRELGLTSF